MSLLEVVALRGISPVRMLAPMLFPQQPLGNRNTVLGIYVLDKSEYFDIYAIVLGKYCSAVHHGCKEVSK